MDVPKTLLHGRIGKISHYC